MRCENSGVLNIMHPHRNEIALNAKTKTVHVNHWHTFENLQVADGPTGAEVPRFRMSLWEFGGPRVAIFWEHQSSHTKSLGPLRMPYGSIWEVDLSFQMTLRNP